MNNWEKFGGILWAMVSGILGRKVLGCWLSFKWLQGDFGVDLVVEWEAVKVWKMGEFGG